MEKVPGSTWIRNGLSTNKDHKSLVTAIKLTIDKAELTIGNHRMDLILSGQILFRISPDRQSNFRNLEFSGLGCRSRKSIKD